MSDVSVDLGLNAAKFDSDLARSLGGLQVWGDKAGGSLDRLSGSGENLLRSNHRVATQIHHLSQVLAAGGNAADIMGVGLEGLARSLNLSLGALAGLGIAAAIGAKFAKSFQEAHKLSVEIESIGKELNKGDADFQALDVLEKRLERVHQAAKKLRGEQSGAFNTVRNIFRDPFADRSAEELTKLEDKKRKASSDIAGRLGIQADIEELLAAGDKFGAKRKELGLDREKELSKLEDQKLSGPAAEEAKANIDREYIAKAAALSAEESAVHRQLELEMQIVAIQAAGGDVSLKIADARIAAAQKELDLTQQGTVEYDKRLEALEKESAAKVEIARKARESLQQPLEEISKRSNDPNSATATAWWEGMQAREAVRLKDLGKQEQNMYGGEAGIAARADREKQALAVEDQIGSLKDSEKDLSGAVRAGFDASSRLGELIEAVRRISFASTN